MFTEVKTWGPSPNYPKVRQYNPEKKNYYIAGPCSVQDKEMIYSLAKQVAHAGATHLRGGVFRAGSYPGHKFGYVEEELIKCYHAAAQLYGLKNIIEVLDYTDESLDFITPYADCFQIGSRSTQNYTLLKKLSNSGKTVFLKRNQGATVDEWLGAAEYLLHGDCTPVLIERGISTFETHCRWSLSISSIPAVKAISGIPILVDASHGTGRRDLVPSMTLAGIAAGADGCLVEVHDDPERSLSDPDQAVTPYTYSKIMEKVFKIKEIV